MEMEEAFLFDKSLIICQNKGKTELFGSEDEYSFWIRFPMNTLKVRQQGALLSFNNMPHWSSIQLFLNMDARRNF